MLFFAIGLSSISGIYSSLLPLLLRSFGSQIVVNAQTRPRAHRASDKNVQQGRSSFCRCFSLSLFYRAECVTSVLIVLTTYAHGCYFLHRIVRFPIDLFYVRECELSIFFSHLLFPVSNIRENHFEVGK